MTRRESGSTGSRFPPHLVDTTMMFFWSIIRSISDSLLSIIEKTVVLDKDENLVLKQEESCPEEAASRETVKKRRSRIKRVSFANVHVREHSLIVGDNHHVVGGWPLSMDWKCSTTKTLDINAFEENRRHHDPSRSLAPLTVTERLYRLKILGHSDATLRQAERQRKYQLTKERMYDALNHFLSK